MDKERPEYLSRLPGKIFARICIAFIPYTFIYGIVVRFNKEVGWHFYFKSMLFIFIILVLLLIIPIIIALFPNNKEKDLG